MWRDGYWNSTVEKAFRGRVIIRPGWTRRPRGWQWKKSRRASGAKLWKGSWNGSGWLPRPATPSPRPVWEHTRNSQLKMGRRRRQIWKFISLTVRGWATRSLSSTTCPRPTGRSCSSNIFPSYFRLRALWVSSVLTVPERQLYSGSLWA